MDGENPIILENSPYAVGSIQHFKEVSAGAGNTIWKVNSEGQFMGANNYTDAPWRVSYTGVQRLGANGEIVLDGPNGTITVGSSTVIDGTGLNSVQNFLSDTIFDDTNRSPASTSYEDIPGASMTPFTLTRQARVLTYVRAEMYHVDYNNDGQNYQVYVRMIDTFDNEVTDGVVSGGNWVVDDVNFGGSSWSSHVEGQELTSISNDLFAAGTHTLKAQYKVDGGTGDLLELQIGYVILGV